MVLKKIVFFICFFAVFFCLALVSFAESSYVFTLDDMTEYSRIEYLQPASGNYNPFFVSKPPVQYVGYDWAATASIPYTTLEAQGSLRFRLETVEAVKVPANSKTVVLTFDFDLFRQFPVIMQGYQDASLYVNGIRIPVDDVTFEVVDPRTQRFHLIADISNGVSSTSSTITSFNFTVNFKTNNMSGQSGTLDIPGYFPVYTFYESSIEKLLPELAGQIMDNQDKNTQQIIDNQDKNTQQIIDNQDKNTQQILDGDPANEAALQEQQQIYNDIKAQEEAFFSSFTSGLDGKVDDMLNQLNSINEGLASNGEIVESNTWFKKLWNAIVPQSPGNWWSDYFLLIPIALSVIISFSVKVLRSVGNSSIGKSDKGGGKS